MVIYDYLWLFTIIFGYLQIFTIIFVYFCVFSEISATTGTIIGFLRNARAIQLPKVRRITCCSLYAVSYTHLTLPTM